VRAEFFDKSLAIRKSQSFMHDAEDMASVERQLINLERTRLQYVKERGSSSTVVALDFGLPSSLAYLRAPAVLYFSK